MIELCEHTFKPVNDAIDIMMGLHRVLENDLSGWDTYMVLETSSQRIFMDLYLEVNGFRFRCEVKSDLILIRGIKEDVLDFIELVLEEFPGFKSELYEVEPLIVFDPNCKECNDELNIGKVIMAII